MSESILKALEGLEHTFGIQQRELADRVLNLEQKGGARFERTTEGVGIGENFIKEFDANRDMLAKTGKLRLELNFKAAGDPVTTASGRRIISAGVGAPAAGVIGFQDALRQRAVPGTTAIEYSRYTGIEGAAAQQAAEGDTKASVRPTHTLIQQTAITIAGLTKISKQALNDSAELKAAVETVLYRSCATALDTALVSGATGFTGGYSGLAFSVTSGTYTALVDAVSEAVANMRVAGFVADVVALAPADFLAMQVLKGTDGHYLSGPPLGALPQELRGLRVVLSPTVDAGKALVCDSAHSELLIVDSFGVEVGTDGDDFSKNLYTLRGELRVIPVFRTAASMRLVTPKA